MIIYQFSLKNLPIQIISNGANFELSNFDNCLTAISIDGMIMFNVSLIL